MKKENQNKNDNIIVFKSFEITTKKTKQFLKDFAQLCKKYSDDDKFHFKFEIEK